MTNTRKVQTREFIALFVYIKSDGELRHTTLCDFPHVEWLAWDVLWRCILAVVQQRSHDLLLRVLAPLCVCVCVHMWTKQVLTHVLWGDCSQSARMHHDIMANRTPKQRCTGVSQNEEAFNMYFHAFLTANNSTRIHSQSISCIRFTYVILGEHLFSLIQPFARKMIVLRFVHQKIGAACRFLSKESVLPPGNKIIPSSVELTNASTYTNRCVCII